MGTRAASQPATHTSGSSSFLFGRVPHWHPLPTCPPNSPSVSLLLERQPHQAVSYSVFSALGQYMILLTNPKLTVGPQPLKNGATPNETYRAGPCQTERIIRSFLVMTDTLADSPFPCPTYASPRPQSTTWSSSAPLYFPHTWELSLPSLQIPSHRE